MTMISHAKDDISPRGEMEKAMSLTIGMASPLWLAFGAAASAGAAWWWMTKWSRRVNLEAPATLPRSARKTPAPAAPRAPETVPAIAPVAAPRMVEAVELEPAKAEPAKLKIVAEPDDLTRLYGIGPRLAQALAERGVTRFADIAAWTDEDLKRIDAELSLKGRAIRDAWAPQARRFAAED